LIEVGIGDVNNGELVASCIFGVIFGLAVSESHVTFDGEQVGEEAAGEHDDQTGVGQMDAEFAPRPPETFRMRRDQINQQHRTDEVATGENGKFYAPTFCWPPNEEALEVTLLRFVNPQMHLRQCARENECHPRCQTDDG